MRAKSVGWLAGVVLLGLVVGSVDAQKALTPERAAAMRTLGPVAIAPDGRHVVYSVTVPNLTESTTNSDIWLVPSAGGESIRLTSSKGVGE